MRAARWWQPLPPRRAVGPRSLAFKYPAIHFAYPLLVKVRLILTIRTRRKWKSTRRSYAARFLACAGSEPRTSMRRWQRHGPSQMRRETPSMWDTGHGIISDESTGRRRARAATTLDMT